MTDLDREIHVQAFGDDPEQSVKKIGRIPRYCQSIALAWLVVEEMERRGYDWIIEKDGDRLMVTFWSTHQKTHTTDYSKVSMQYVTVPQAICRAALETLKNDNP